MAEHKDDASAVPLYQYSERLDAWASNLFDRHKSMKDVDLGKLFKEYGKNERRLELRLIC